MFKSLMMVVGLGLLGVGCVESVKDERPPKYQGETYRYYSPGAEGYGPPNAVRKTEPGKR